MQALEHGIHEKHIFLFCVFGVSVIDTSFLMMTVSY